jgi:hypothetical protein
VADSSNRLEAELAGMRPRAFPRELADRIEQRLARTGQWADACLLSAMSAGAIAACIIVVVLGSQPSGPLPAPALSGGIADAPRFGDLPQSLAWVDKQAKSTENP